MHNIKKCCKLFRRNKISPEIHAELPHKRKKLPFVSVSVDLKFLWDVQRLLLYILYETENTVEFCRYIRKVLVLFLLKSTVAVSNFPTHSGPRINLIRRDGARCIPNVRGSRIIFAQLVFEVSTGWKWMKKVWMSFGNTIRRYGLAAVVFQSDFELLSFCIRELYLIWF